MLKLMRIGPEGEERPYAVENDVDWYPLDALGADVDGGLFTRGGFDLVRAAIADGTVTASPEAPGDRIGSPLSRPTAIICVGMNYAAHARETGAEPPKSPVLFFKHPNTLVGPDDDVIRPPDARRLDWEVELGIVIGRRASYLSSPQEAEDHIAGYVLSNDVSEREYQMERSGGQWSKGKCAPTFNPLGPAIVERAGVDLASARIWSRVNGEPRQESTISDMIFDPAYVVWYLSQYMALEPGDLVNTGTPEGVALSGRFPYLEDGDVVELGIDGLGVQTQTIRAL